MYRPVCIMRTDKFRALTRGAYSLSELVRCIGQLFADAAKLRGWAVYEKAVYLFKAIILVCLEVVLICIKSNLSLTDLMYSICKVADPAGPLVP